MSGRKYHHPDEQFGFDIFPQRSGRRTMREKNYLLKNTFWNRKRSTECGRRDGGFDVFGNVILLTPKEHHARIPERLEARYDTDEEVAFGATQLPNECGLVFKVLGIDSPKTKEAVRYFWQIARKRSSASHCRNRSCGADALQDDTGGYSGTGYYQHNQSLCPVYLQGKTMATSTVSQNGWNKLAGSNPVIHFIDITLRGCAQVMFQNNPLTGLFFSPLFLSVHTVKAFRRSAGAVCSVPWCPR